MCSALQPAIRLPKPLRPGDRIAVIAPASPFTRGKLLQACTMVENAGYRIVLGRRVFARNGYLAGDDRQRADDLVEALQDDGIAAVFCSRGGYGCSRLIPHVPFAEVANHAKIFLGFSDITFLHAAFFTQCGWATFHGPNLSALAHNPVAISRLLQDLGGERPFLWPLTETQVMRGGRTSGPVLGGNLTCLVHLAGTQYFPDVTGALLLIEDRGEKLYRIDRLLNHLKLLGVFEQLGGLLIGQFKECGDYRSILEIVWDHVRDFRFPVVHSLPFGHVEDNRIIPFGNPFDLNTHDGYLKAAQSPFAID